MTNHVMEAVDLDDGGSVRCLGCRQFVYGSLTATPPGECPTPYKSPQQQLAESLAREANLVDQLEQKRIEIIDEASKAIESYGQVADMQARLAIADELVREAWRLMDGQAAKTAHWHLAASQYINNPTVDAWADTTRLDLYERIHHQEFALVPYFDDAVAKWFIPPADDDQGDGRTFETLREALDWIAGEAAADHG